MRRGSVVGGRFEILELAGSGGMGTVYRAVDRNGGEVALKLLHSDDPKGLERFIREARLLADLSHPGIVRYVAHGAEGDTPFLAMEWLEGEGLDERLSRGPLAVTDARSLALRLCAALAIAHERGIVHRDIKPSNIFLCGGRVEDVRLLDFGIARLLTASRAITRTGLAIGTPAYMAPEQARGESQLDARADVFSVGCVLFETLAGRPVFEGAHALAILGKVLFEEATPVHEIRPDVPVGLSQLCAAMLSKDRASRPADAAEIVRRLTDVETVEDAPTREVQAAGRGLTARENRLMCAIVAGDAGGDPDPTLLRSADQGHSTELDCIGERYGLRLESLIDGTVLGLCDGVAGATDAAIRAARCALALHAQNPGRPVILTTGRGDSSGILPTGPAIDRAVNLARVSSTNRRTAQSGVFIDEVSASLLEARFIVHREDAGWRLIEERDEGGSIRQLLGRPTPCVGRERELLFLNELFSECIEESTARSVLVTGPPGIGKSRLLHEFLQSARKRDQEFSVWLAHGDPLKASAPFALIAALLRSAARGWDVPTVGDLGRHLAARVEQVVAEPDRPRIAAFLCEIAGVPLPDDLAPRCSPGDLIAAAREQPALMAEQMQRAWTDFLACDLASTPILIVLDDMQWADASSLRLLETTLRALYDRPLMVMAVARPEIHDLFPRLWADRGAQEIRLRELTRRASENLVLSALGDVDRALLTQIVERSGGNAFFLEELIRSVNEGQSELPETIISIVQGRLEALEADHRRALRAASIFGNRFWLGGVAALLGDKLYADSLATIFAVLLERELVTALAEGSIPGESHFAFRQGFLRDAAYGMLTEEDALVGHRLAGEWLEGKGVRDASTLAHHFECGAEWKRAGEWHIRGAEDAFRRARYDEGDRHAAAAERLAREHSDEPLLGRALCVRGRIACARGDFPRAVEYLQPASELAESVGDVALLAEIERGIARSLIDRGEYAAAAERYSRSRTHSVAIGEQQGAGVSCLGLSEIDKQRGELEGSMKWLDIAHAHFSASNSQWGLANVAMARGEIHRLQGEIELAEREYLEAGQRFAPIGAGQAIFAEINLALVRLAQRNWEGARVLLEGGLQAVRERGRRAIEGALLIALALCAEAESRDDDADALLDSGIAILRETGYIDVDTAQLATSLGEISEQHENGDRARRAYELALWQLESLERHDQASDIRSRLDTLRDGGC